MCFIFEPIILTKIQKNDKEKIKHDNEDKDRNIIQSKNHVYVLPICQMAIELNNAKQMK